MSDLEKRVGEALRNFNINRPDIKELWETNRFGTIAVPADRYKQYYDVIVEQQSKLEKAIEALERIDKIALNLLPVAMPGRARGQSDKMYKIAQQALAEIKEL